MFKDAARAAFGTEGTADVDDGEEGARIPKAYSSERVSRSLRTPWPVLPSRQPLDEPTASGPVSSEHCR